MKRFGGMGGGGEDKVGDSYLNGGLLVEEEGTGPLDNSGDKESIGSTAAATTRHDGGDPDLIAIVDELFHEEERRKGSNAAAATREEDEEEKKERRSTRDSKLTEKMAEYLGRKKRGVESGEDTEKNDGSNRGSSEYEKSKSSNPHPPSNNNAGVIFKIDEIDVEGTLHAAINSKNEISKPISLGKQWYDKFFLQEQQQIDYGIDALLYEGCMVAARRIFDQVVLQTMAIEEGDGVEYRRRSKRQRVTTDKMAIFQTGKEKGSSAAATTRHDMGREEVGGIGTEGDVAEEVRGNISGAPSTSLPHDFYVGQLVNVIEGKASHQASIEVIEKEQATVRWSGWKGCDVVQVNQLCPIWVNSPRKRKQTDLYGFSQLKPATTSTRIQKRLPMRHYRKLQMLEEQPEITQELLERANPNTPQVEKKLEDAEDRKLPMLEEQPEITQEAEESTLRSPPAPSKIWHCPDCTYPNWWDWGGPICNLCGTACPTSWRPPPPSPAATRLLKQKLPMRHYRKLPEKEVESSSDCAQDATLSRALIYSATLHLNMYSETSSVSDVQGLSTAKAGGRSIISSPEFRVLISTELDALRCNMVEGKEEGVVQEYLRRQDCQVTTEHFMGRRKIKIAPPIIQIKYTGLDILAMGVMIAEEWRPDVIELIDFAEKINKGREAVRKLVRHYIAKKHLQRSREETMKLLRPLNPEEQKLVDEAMKKGDRSEILAQSGTDSVQRGSMWRLMPGQWLNDEIINYFLKNCLARRDENLCKKDPGRRRSHFYNSFFVQTMFDEKSDVKKLRGIYNYEMVRRWSMKVPTPRDIFSLKYIFCPINIDNYHWTLAVIFMEAKKIQYFDSSGGTDWKKIKGLLQYLKDEYRATHDGEEMDATEWELVPCKSDTPRQKNGEFHLKVSACQETQYFTLLPPL
jgi:sentrin-specific protease 1